MGETISIEAELQNFKEVSAGDSLYAVNSAERWNSLRRLILALASGQNIKRGANMLKKTGPTWCVLSAIDQGESVATAPIFRLQILNATEDPATPKYRVRLGYVAGLIADAGMTDPTDDPVFKKTVGSPAAGTFWVYCKLAATYNSAGKWTFAAGEIHEYSSAQSDTASAGAGYVYVLLGTFTIATATGGYSLTVNTPQAVGGDQAVARDGNGDYADHKNWTVASV